MSAPQNRQTLPTMLGRAVRRRCPWCGGKRAWFTGWFRKAPRCPTCGLKWDRGQDGVELGAMLVGIFVTGGTAVLSIVIGIIATYPDIAVVPILAIGGSLVVTVAVVTYPFTYTLWSAVDLAVHPPEAHELESAARHLAGAGETATPS